MQRRFHPILSTASSALALAGALALWTAEAAAAGRNHSDPASGRDSSRGSGASSRSTPAPSATPSAAPSSPAGDTRPSPGVSPGRVTDDARGRGTYRSGSHRRGGSRGHYGGYYGGYYGAYGYYPWGWFGFRAFPYSYWGDYYGSPYGHTVVYPNNRYGDAGALDMDVSPERAEVYLDGERIGTADEFDGFPSLLWLERGTYDLAIYLDGFRTIARQVTIYPGLIIDVEDRMERGESVRPEDLPTRTHVRRDARIREDREREAEVDARDRDYRDWRARRAQSAAAARQGDDGAVGEDERSEIAGDSAAVRIEVEPADASVYLDGRFVGTGSELARLPAGIVVEPGDHQLEVVRPGHQPQRRSFAVRAGEALDLEVELVAD